MDKVRELALKALYKIEENGAYSNIVLDETINNNKEKLNKRDIGLISELIYGVTSWRLTLDELIKMHSKIRLKKISPWIINILRMGIYQIVFLDKIPKSAAVNESVNLAKKYGNRGSISFTNAVLRKIEKDDYKQLFIIKDPIEKISKTTSMPIWIVEKLIEQKGEEVTQEICNNSNIKPNITIRINNLKINNDKFKLKLLEDKIEYEETEYDNFLILKNQKDIENLTLFKEGFFTVQDLSAGLSAKKLNPQSGESVLDCCSAPGGKTTYLAEIMNNKGNIEAWDIHKQRVELVDKASKRLGIDIIKTKVKDATVYDQNYVEKFDKILLDVPCLGLGVIKRKPDIKWQRNPEDIEKISKIQFEILQTCSKYLKSNGKLVYSTCSILEEENQNIIEQFLKQNKNFKYSNENEKNININTGIKYDGFFICELKKIQ